MTPTMKQEYITYSHYYNFINLLFDLGIISYNRAIHAKINPPAAIRATLFTED